MLPAGPKTIQLPVKGGDTVTVTIVGRFEPKPAAAKASADEATAAPAEPSAETEAAAATAEGQAVTVVTADRELRGRVTAAGAETVGPKWLLDRL